MNAILAKLSQNDKLIGGGAVAAVVGWILGQVLGSAQTCASYLGQQVCSGFSVNYFSWGNAGLLSILAALAAIAAIVVLYLKVSSAQITWPMPVAQILLGACAAALILAALAVLMQFSNNLPGTPVLMYVADVVLVGGGAVATYGAYLEWTASKVA